MAENRNKGTFKFAATLEVQAAAALDPRVVVDTKAQLIDKETWPYEGDTLYLYEGLVVAVKADKAIFMLIDKAKALAADYSGWKQLDVAAAATVEIIDNLTSQATNAALSANQGYQLKKEIDALGAKFTAVYTYKGTKPTYAELEAVASPTIGDVYNVDEAHNGIPAGTNYAWNGTAWDALGGAVDLSKYYTKEEIDALIVTKNEDGNTVLEGDLVVEKPDGTSVNIAGVDETGNVVVGDPNSPLKLEGSEERPNYSNGTDTSELALLKDVQTGDANTLKSAKDYVDQKVGSMDLSGLVEKEDGKELIPTEKLELIDTNATEISTLKADVAAAQKAADDLKKVAATITADQLLTDVSDPTASATALTIEFAKADANGTAFAAGDAKTVTIPAATTTAAGVMTAADKTTLNTVNTSVSTLKSTTDGLVESVTTLNGTDSEAGSVRNIAKTAAEKAVSDGMEWIEVAPEA